MHEPHAGRSVDAGAHARLAPPRTLSADQVRRLRQQFDASNATGQELARAFARLLVERGVVAEGSPGLGLTRKTRSLAATLTLVIKNADMLDSIRTVMARGSIPPLGVLNTDRFHAEVRRALRDVLRQACERPGERWSPSDEAVWASVVEVVSDASFGVRSAPVRKAA